MAQIKNIKWPGRLLIIAILAGLALIAQQYSNQTSDLQVTLHFSRASGIVENATVIKYLGVEVGKVSSLKFLGPDKVEVKAILHKEVLPLIRKNTRFALVSPEVSLQDLSGIQTLVTGSYIDLLPGDGELIKVFDFSYQHYTSAVPPYTIHLHTNNLNHIKKHSVIYFRGIKVGEIVSYEVEDYSLNNFKARLDAIIFPQYTKLITKNIRFWKVPKIKANFNIKGLSLNVGDLDSFILGSVAFDIVDENVSSNETLPSGSNFFLYEKESLIDKNLVLEILFSNKNLYLSNRQLNLTYKGLILGELSNIKDDVGNIKGEIRIDPKFKDLFRSNSKIVLIRPKLQKANIASIQEILQGGYLTVIPGSGKHKKKFDIQEEYEVYLKNPKNLILNLHADSSYGVEVGHPILFKNIAIGQVAKRKLNKEFVDFTIIIFDKYKHLITEGSKFAAAGNLDISIKNGALILGNNFKEWIFGGIVVIPSYSKKPISKTPKILYPRIEDANQSKNEPTLRLHTKNLYNIEKGSILLYNNFPIGNVLDIIPTQHSFKVDLWIDPKYRHLLRKNTYFWNDKPAGVKLDSSGIDVKVIPLTRVIRGVVSMGNIGSEKEDHPLSQTRKIYSSQEDAKEAVLQSKYALEGSQYIFLYAEESHGLQLGAPLLFKGIKVGTLERMVIAKNFDKVIFKLKILPQYRHLIRKNSIFWVASAYSLKWSWTGIDLKSNGIKSMLLGAIMFTVPDPANEISDKCIFKLNRKEPSRLNKMRS